MQFVVLFLKLIAFILIKIGDTVISLFQLLFFLLKKLIFLIKYLFLAALLLLRTGTIAVKHTFLFLVNIPKQIIFFASLPVRKLAGTWRTSRKQKYKRPATHILYQRTKTFSFLSKFKYFVAGSFFSLIFIFVPLLVVILLQNLPDPKSLSVGQIPQTTKIYDRNNTLLYEIYGAQNRTIIPLTEIPSDLQNATIAIEDKDFYKHPGFDITAIIRSTIANIKGEYLQGGSTLTQQLIKSTLLSPETKLTRKIKELILAFWAERIYTKAQILTLYLNQVSYGGTSWGVESASETYFGKKTKDLDLAQSAFLAGIPRAPTIYSPYGETPHAWKKRQKEVLTRMVALGYITNQQQEQALAEDLYFEIPQTPIHAPHFVMYVKNLLIQKYGLAMVERGGLTVKTSLDLKLQDATQKIVSNEVDGGVALHFTNAAALITNPTNGDILAMIGSHNFSDPASGNVNLTTALRQPGSSIKPVTYAAAMTKGFTAATILDDSPIAYTFPGGPTYAPVNYDDRFHGRIPLRFALGNSFNIPAVKTLNQIGLPTMMTLAKKMGITTWGEPDQYGLAITLGGAEVRMVDMATVFGVFANQGKRVDLNPILKITDAKSNVWEEKNPKNEVGTSVLDAGIAYIMSDILADNNARVLEFGPNSPLHIKDHTVSVKTGTTDNKKDNWTIGYTPDWLVATWVGNNDGSFMSQSLASGITGAAPIWSKIMTNLIKDQPDKKPAMPEDVIAKPCFGRTEYFIKGTENSVSCVLPPPVSPTPTPNP